MKNAYIWFSPRGFSNEGTIYVCQEHKADELIEKIQESPIYNECNSVLRRIPRKIVATDKCYLATGDNQPAEDNLAYRINFAYQVTNELFF